eukprot:1004114-Prorocentrum_minimum.AAC.2
MSRERSRQEGGQQGVHRGFGGGRLTEPFKRGDNKRKTIDDANGDYNISEQWVTDPTATWDLTYLGKIHPYSVNDLDPYNLDFIYGYWEEVVCTAPAVAFPSDEYVPTERKQ